MIRTNQDLQHILYINLNHRTDRKINIENELSKVSWREKAIRFPAVEMKNGAMGCTMSHIKCLEIARDNNWRHVVILEDDIEFLDPSLFLSNLDRFLIGTSHDSYSWDVILIAGNNMLPYLPYNECAIQAMNCQTTTGYIVQQKYYNELIQNMKEGLRLFLRNPERKNEYAIDKFWLSLQKKDKWFLIIPLSVIQRENYSDIEKKNTNFRRYMLDYNKVIK